MGSFATFRSLGFSRFSGVRFVLSKWLDRCADWVRPGASMSDIRPGMSREMQRKVATAIVAILKLPEYRPPRSVRQYIPPSYETVEKQWDEYQRRRWEQ
jgi:hypothetical protein